MTVKVTDSFDKVYKKIDENARRAAVAVGTSAGARADEKAPIEFGTLINSRYLDVSEQSDVWRLRVGYMPEYAAYLHNNTNWSPRPPNMKKGNAWNPNAGPYWLRDAFESPEARSDNDKLIAKFMKV